MRAKTASYVYVPMGAYMARTLRIRYIGVCVRTLKVVYIVTYSCGDEVFPYIPDEARVNGFENIIAPVLHGEHSQHPSS